MSEATAKKDIQKLQRAIVDALEDVKAQDIRVFDTEHLSPLFERVVIASGSSNRQTKALAASVRDKVREAGFAKPGVEGEDNGEWIIVDCGRAVVHIFQPVFRQYYKLEELWGEKAVRLKHAAEAKKTAAAKKAPAKTAADKADKADKAEAPARPAAKKAAAKKAPAKTAASKTAASKTTAAKTTAAKPAAKKPAAKKPAAKSASAKKTSTSRKPKASAPLQTLVVNKPVAKKTTARKKAG